MSDKVSDMVVHTVAPAYAKLEIDALEDADVKKDCTKLLKTQVSMAKQLETVDALDEKITNLKGTLDDHRKKQDAAPDVSFGRRVGYVLGGIGAIALCPIAWVAGTVVIGIAAAFVGAAGGNVQRSGPEQDALGGIAAFFYAGPLVLVGGAFYSAVNTKSHWGHKAERTENGLHSLEEKRNRVVQSIDTQKAEMDSQMKKVANRIPKHLHNFASTLSTEVIAAHGTKERNIIQIRYGYDLKDPKKSLARLNEMMTGLKKMEKNLPETVVVRNKGNQIDYLATLDNFRNMPVRDFMQLYSNYHQDSKVPSHLWDHYTNGNKDAITSKAAEYGYLDNLKMSALDYLKSMCIGIANLSKQLPKDMIAHKTRGEIDYMQTFDNVRKVHGEDFLKFVCQHSTLNIGTLFVSCFTNPDNDSIVSVLSKYGYTEKSKRGAYNYLVNVLKGIEKLTKQSSIPKGVIAYSGGKVDYFQTLENLRTMPLEDFRKLHKDYSNWIPKRLNEHERLLAEKAEREVEKAKLQEMLTNLKKMEKDLPETVVVRGKDQEIDYLKTLDNFKKMPLDNFLKLYSKYYQSGISSLLWNSYTHGGALLNKVNEYGYSDRKIPATPIEFLGEVFKAISEMRDFKEMIARGENGEIDYLQTLDTFTKMAAGDFLKFFCDAFKGSKLPWHITAAYIASADNDSFVKEVAKYGYAGSNKKVAFDYLENKLDGISKLESINPWAVLVIKNDKVDYFETLEKLRTMPLEDFMKVHQGWPNLVPVQINDNARLQEMLTSLKKIEKDLPETVIVRGKEQEIDYLKTLDNFRKMPLDDFLKLFSKYYETGISLLLWNSYTHGEALLNKVNEYFYDRIIPATPIEQLEVLFEQIIYTSKEIEIPKEMIARGNNKIDYFQSLDNIRKMPPEDFLKFICKAFDSGKLPNALFNAYVASADNDSFVKVAAKYGYTGNNKIEALDYLLNALRGIARASKPNFFVKKNNKSDFFQTLENLRTMPLDYYLSLNLANEDIPQAINEAARKAPSSKYR